ncbi:MAG: phage head closure protein [Rickettsiales bacterium]
MKGYKLSEPILLQNSKEEANRIGGFKKIWKNYCKCWAAVESLFNKRQLGNEVAFAKELVSMNFYQFTIWFNSKITAKMRVVWNERKFDIIKIIDSDSRKRYMHLLAQEVITEG